MNFQLQNILMLALTSSYIFFPSVVIGQINPDNTTPTTVQQSNTIWTITGGKEVGNNLFHSFQEFSVPTNNAAFFNNSDSINNIFNRVTGGIPSNIDGLIGANGNANLFLLNPNGIIFGANSTLDIGGSFYATTAESILFTDGKEFSANQKQEPLLIISVPVGLQFGDNPGTIINRSQLGLTVLPNKNISLIGGDIQLQGSGIITSGGKVALIALDKDSELKINYDDTDLSFEDISLHKFRDIKLLQSVINTSGEAGGEIKLQGNNISFEFSELRVNNAENINNQNINIQGNNLTLDLFSSIQTSTIGGGKGGDINIEVQESIGLSNFSAIRTFAESSGRGGDINLTTKGSINLSNLIQINAFTSGRGNSGDINLTAKELITLSNGSVINTTTMGRGNSGDINLVTPKSITLSNSSGIDTFSQGSGNSGEINLVALESITLSNSSGINTITVGSGNGGDLNLTTQESITLSNLSEIGANTFGSGNGGDVNLTTSTLLLEDGSLIAVSLADEGNGGTLNIIAQEVQLKGVFLTENDLGELTVQRASGLTANILETGTGQGGTVNLEVDRLLVTDGAQISVSTLGQGNAGELNVTADLIEIDGFSLETNSTLNGVVEDGATGKGGQVNITTERLLLNNGGQVTTATSGAGNAGNLTVKAQSIEILGTDGASGFPSGLITNVQENARGDGGKLTVEAGTITIQNGGVIATNTLGDGNGEDLNITSQSLALRGTSEDGRVSSILANAVGGNGNGADIFIDSDRILIEDQARIDVGNFDSTALQRPPGTGNPGNLNINARSVSLDNQGVISAATFQGETAGNINIQVAESFTSNNSNISNTSEQSSGGTINITAQDIRLRGDSDITTNVFSGAGNGGNITLQADSIVAFDDSDILAFARDGQGGDIILATPAFFGDSFFLQSFTNPNNLDQNNQVDLNASGTVFGQISLPDVNFIFNSLIELPENLIDTENLLADSCVVLNQENTGSLRITGRGGLPIRPEDLNITPYPLGEIKTIPNSKNNSQVIIEPQGVYQLPDGRLILSRQC